MYVHYMCFPSEAPQPAKKPRVEAMPAPVNLDADDPLDDDDDVCILCVHVHVTKFFNQDVPV